MIMIITYIYIPIFGHYSLFLHATVILILICASKFLNLFSKIWRLQILFVSYNQGEYRLRIWAEFGKKKLIQKIIWQENTGE
jgi:hypothetical protein